MAAAIIGERMKTAGFAVVSVVSMACGGLAVGCGSDHDSGYGYGSGEKVSDYGDLCQLQRPTASQSVDIDTDQTLDADPGAGVFVEYAAGGTYHLFTTCDTDTSKLSCRWSFTASIDPTLSLAVTDDGSLESDDTITRLDKGGVRLDFTTDADADGVAIKVPAGESLRLNMLLDGCYDPRFVNWVSDGSVRTGSPSDPLVFVPTSP
ncbi:MAG TPA: hypothetical protein VH062_05475 [Polyangiaceae bacterium]|nr:hypothetical protein [Polyangiaceae bacterium]